MSTTEFEKNLITFISREPFQSFEIEMVDGQRLTIDRPDAVGFNEGAGAFIAGDGSIHFFDNQKVRRIGNVNGTSSVS